MQNSAWLCFLLCTQVFRLEDVYISVSRAFSAPVPAGRPTQFSARYGHPRPGPTGRGGGWGRHPNGGGGGAGQGPSSTTPATRGSAWTRSCTSRRPSSSVTCRSGPRGCSCGSTSPSAAPSASRQSPGSHPTAGGSGGGGGVAFCPELPPPRPSDCISCRAIHGWTVIVKNAKVEWVCSSKSFQS